MKYLAPLFVPILLLSTFASAEEAAPPQQKNRILLKTGYYKCGDQTVSLWEDERQLKLGDLEGPEHNKSIQGGYAPLVTSTYRYTFPIPTTDGIGYAYDAEEALILESGEYRKYSSQTATATVTPKSSTEFTLASHGANFTWGYLAYLPYFEDLTWVLVRDAVVYFSEDKLNITCKRVPALK